MKKILILISVAILFVGCETTLNAIDDLAEYYGPKATTYDGQGSYQQLQTDRYKCAIETVTDTTAVAGRSNQYGANVSGSSTQRPNCGLFQACLGAKGWTRNYAGTGTAIANTILCNY